MRSRVAPYRPGQAVPNFGLGASPNWGRLWAVRGPPATTASGRQWPRACWSEVPCVTYVEAAGTAHQFLRNKKQEWEEYRSEVTAFELRKNLPVL
ncbi:hypothetical protein GCM10010388_09210 [Streptomyces mauvecolor]